MEDECLILKKLEIEHFGNIRHVDIVFDEQLTAIRHLNADEIIKAIGLATDNTSLSGRIAARTITGDTYIELELEVGGHPYLITAKGLPRKKSCIYEAVDRKSDSAIDASKIFRHIRLCKEEENLTYYRYTSKDAYAERFLHYKDPDKYYPLGIFQKITDGMGLTQTFRTCLSEYIKTYEPCVVTDNKLFDLEYYLSVNKFWSSFENVRNMHHEKWPMIINVTNFQKTEDFKAQIVKALDLGRQLITIEKG